MADHGSLRLIPSEALARRTGFARALTLARLRAGLTQEEAASRIGMARANYAQCEIGKRRPGPGLRSRIEAALGVDFEGVE